MTKNTKLTIKPDTKIWMLKIIDLNIQNIAFTLSDKNKSTKFKEYITKKEIQINEYSELLTIKNELAKYNDNTIRQDYSRIFLSNSDTFGEGIRPSQYIFFIFEGYFIIVNKKDLIVNKTKQIIYKIKMATPYYFRVVADEFVTKEDIQTLEGYNLFTSFIDSENQQLQALRNNDDLLLSFANRVHSITLKGKNGIVKQQWQFN